MDPTTASFGARRINFLRSQLGYIPLPAAASIVLQRASKAIPPIKFPDDPGDTLSIVAGALARLVGIYAFDRARGCHTPVAPRVFNRWSTLTSLSVRRSELAAALLLIRRSGLPFIVAMSLRPKAPNDAPAS